MFFIMMLFLWSSIALYLSVRGVYRLNVRLKWKILLEIPILLGSFQMIIGFLFDLSGEWIMIIFGFLQGVVLIWFLFLIVIDLMALSGIFISYIIPISMIISCILSGWGVYNAIKIPNVKWVEIKSRFLPDNWTELRVVQLSDLHIGSGFKKEWLEKVVEKTNRLNPDIIVITGDVIDRGYQRSQNDILPIKKLMAKQGVYMIFGNHEMYFWSDDWSNFFKTTSIKIINNKAVVLKNKENTYTITNRLNDIPYSDFKIYLSHYPADFKNAIGKIDLQLSGHTHGGQMPLFRQIVARSNAGYVRGLYKDNSSFLYVSSGTGLWGGFPIRLWTPSEITVFTIKKD